MLKPNELDITYGDLVIAVLPPYDHPAMYRDPQLFVGFVKHLVRDALRSMEGHSERIDSILNIYQQELGEMTFPEWTARHQDEIYGDHLSKLQRLPVLIKCKAWWLIEIKLIALLDDRLDVSGKLHHLSWKVATGMMPEIQPLPPIDNE